MSDHLVLFVDRLIRPAAVQSAAPESSEVVSGPVGGGANDGPGPNAAGPSNSAVTEEKKQLEEEDEDEDEGLGEEEPLIQTAECRICQEEDSIKDLETPCACSGSLKVYLYDYTQRKIFNFVLINGFLFFPFWVDATKICVIRVIYPMKCSRVNLILNLRDLVYKVGIFLIFFSLLVIMENTLYRLSSQN